MIVRMLDIHAQHIRHQAADKRKFRLALPKHRFHAFADSFALGFQIAPAISAAKSAPNDAPLPRPAARRPARICLPSAAALPRFSSSSACCRSIVAEQFRAASPPVPRAAASSLSNSLRTCSRRVPRRDSCGSHVFPLDLDRPQPAADRRQLAASDPKSPTSAFRSAARAEFSCSLPVAELLLPRFDQSPLLFQFGRQRLPAPPFPPPAIAAISASFASISDLSRSNPASCSAICSSCCTAYCCRCRAD